VTPEEREARQRGEVAASPLLAAAGALGGAAIAIAVGGEDAAHRLAQLAQAAFSGKLDPQAAAGGLPGQLARLVLPVAAAALVGGLLLGMAQTRALFTLGAIGVRRREREGVAIPWALAAAAGVIMVWAARAEAPSLARAEGLAGALAASGEALARLAPRAVLLFAAAGLADWALRRIQQEKRRPEREGPDPRLAAEQRRRQRQ
jgi:hypothetical protein